MRKLGFCFLFACLPLVGCLKPKPQPPIDKIDTGKGAPTADTLVSYLNRQADRLVTLESTDVDLTAFVQKQRMPTLRAFMVCEKSRNFRLTGDAMSVQYVDIGSNNDQFWFWVKDGEAPLYYCSYNDYQKGVKLPLPFQPEWVVQALGMAKYDPTKQYKVEARRDTYELTEDITVQGQPYRKITVFAAQRPSDATYPVVRGHIIQDQAGKTICQATIRRMRTASYKTTEGEEVISYPSDILLEWPAEQMSMKMVIGKASVNQKITNEEASRYFTLPNWPNIKTIDLARYRPSGSPTSRDIRQAGGYR